jgi:hypothetical protein
MDKKLIAPCGMNCGVCIAYLRNKNKCPGCSFGRIVNKRCVNCSIKLCEERKGDYCFSCDKFPCERLKRMDKRYKEKYEMSLIDNLKAIKEMGINSFIKHEEIKWINSEGTCCVHDKKRYL